jgi:hypothetical protein
LPTEKFALNLSEEIRIFKTFTLGKQTRRVNSRQDTSTNRKSFCGTSGVRTQWCLLYSISKKVVPNFWRGSVKTIKGKEIMAQFLNEVVRMTNLLYAWRIDREG